MATGEERRARRGPAPIASFDHDGSDESSPETKQTFQLPEIREDAAPGGAGGGAGGGGLAPAGEPRARSQSTPGLGAPPAPRIDISRASSSSHHDSRDSSPELALFAGTDTDAGDADGRGARLELGFREDGALELRSSTEELAFLEPAPPPSAPPPPAAPPPRRHSRKDSQGSEAALLGVSGRTSRLSSVGSQCSAQSALSGLSHVSRLSVVSGVSRSPSPHKMLLETSFCGPKPIETDPEICAAAVEERLLEIAKMTAPPPAPVTAAAPTPAPADARDRREVRTEVTLENARPASRPAPAPVPVPAPTAPVPAIVTPAEEKRQKESRNEERRARPRVRRDPSEPEVYKSRNRSKDIIRIKLKPDDESEEDEDESSRTLTTDAQRAARPTALVRPPPAPSPTPSRRSPSPSGAPVSRKSSFCSLFKSRETIASPDSPSEALRRKKSLNEGRSRSKSRDRSATPSSAGKIRGSVLSLFKTPRRSGASPSPGSRAASPVVQPAPAPAPAPAPPAPPARDPLLYYEDAPDGVIHIPLRTPPADSPRAGAAPRPASAPAGPPAPARRTVLPDGSIIIPLHSPTERAAPDVTVVRVEPPPPARDEHAREEARRRVVAAVEPPPPATPATPSALPAEPSPEETGAPSDRTTPASPADATRPGPARRRLVFTTHVGSTEQVFSTQFSLTKTPSVTSEISGSFASFPEDLRPAAATLRDTHITTSEPEVSPPDAAPTGGEAAGEPAGELAVEQVVEASTPLSTRDSSSSEPSSEAPRAPGTQGTDAEQRGLVVQESFDEELPYVPTTLPLERSLALPMVPVRDRGTLHHSIARVERPRGATPSGRVPRAPPPSLPAPPAPPPGSADKLRIRLPRRPRTASTVSGIAAPPAPERTRTRSGSDGRVTMVTEPRPKPEWIDFEEVPERRKQPRRIQTLPAAGPRDAPGATVLLSYAEPDECRCECHAHAASSSSPPDPDADPDASRRDDELPLLHEHVISPGGPENGERARPFTADLDLRHDHSHAHSHAHAQHTHSDGARH